MDGQSWTIEFTVTDMDVELMKTLFGFGPDGELEPGWHWEDIDPSSPEYDKEYATRRAVRNAWCSRCEVRYVRVGTLCHLCAPGGGLTRENQRTLQHHSPGKNLHETGNDSELVT